MKILKDFGRRKKDRNIRHKFKLGALLSFILCTIYILIEFEAKNFDIIEMSTTKSKYEGEQSPQYLQKDRGNNILHNNSLFFERQFASSLNGYENLLLSCLFSLINII